MNFQLDTNYACEIFQSCEKEPFIAQSDITSSLAFMDFLGVNGQNQSLSIITFSFSDDPTTSLGGEAYSCATDPVDGFVNSYPNNKQCVCSYCSEVCTAPAVNADIAFFDGFNFKIVGWSYFAFILFTLAFQLIAHFICRRKPPTRIANLRENNSDANFSRISGPAPAMRLNQTTETSMTSEQNSLLRRADIRP